MSNEIKIQTEPTPQGEVDLSSDAAKGRIKGGDFNQNQLSFSRGVEVPSGSGDTAKGYATTGIAVSVKPTDRRTVEGSTPGDFRAQPGDTAKASLIAVSGSTKGPRDSVQQFANGKNCKSAPAAQSYPGTLTDSDGGN